VWRRRCTRIKWIPNESRKSRSGGMQAETRFHALTGNGSFFLIYWIQVESCSPPSQIDMTPSHPSLILSRYWASLLSDRNLTSNFVEIFKTVKELLLPCRSSKSFVEERVSSLGTVGGEWKGWADGDQHSSVSVSLHLTYSLSLTSFVFSINHYPLFNLA
jgi:hypothetical protein